MLFETPKPKKIILVDDDPVNLQICKMVFSRTINDIEFKIFEEGHGAYQWISENESELVKNDDFILMLDLNMPVMDGWEFLGNFERLENSVQQKFHVYILTSSINTEDIEHARDFRSVKHFYNKPLTRKIINEILSDSRPTIH
jgi:CheY-like chemotaxis protein